MGIRSFGQQGIVFAVFAALFAVFALILPGFLTTANMLTLLQNVAVLGILGLIRFPFSAATSSSPSKTRRNYIQKLP